MAITENKNKVSSLAKDFGMQSKDIIAILKDYTEAPKGHSQVLSDRELSIVFDYLTLHHQVKIDLRAARLQLLQHLPALAVGADEHRLPRCRLLGRRDQTHPLALQLRDDIGVVDNAPEHRAAMRLGRFVRERDRALHAVAEACGLSKNDPHSGAPPTA